jgi:hypothetical protein
MKVGVIAGLARKRNLGHNADHRASRDFKGLLSLAHPYRLAKVL